MFQQQVIATALPTNDVSGADAAATATATPTEDHQLGGGGGGAKKADAGRGGAPIDADTDQQVSWLICWSAGGVLRGYWLVGWVVRVLGVFADGLTPLCFMRVDVRCAVCVLCMCFVCVCACAAYVCVWCVWPRQNQSPGPHRKTVPVAPQHRVANVRRQKRVDSNRVPVDRHVVQSHPDAGQDGLRPDQRRLGTRAACSLWMAHSPADTVGWCT